MSQFASHPLQETMGPEAWKQLKHDIQYGKVSWPIGVVKVTQTEQVAAAIAQTKVRKLHDDVYFGSERPAVHPHNIQEAVEAASACDFHSNVRKQFADMPSQVESDIIAERGKVYGDPKENHEGIAMQWAPMLQPHWEAIRDMKPLPAHVVTVLMALVKVNRMRLVYHADNFDDAKIYLDFTEQFQR